VHLEVSQRPVFFSYLLMPFFMRNLTDVNPSLGVTLPTLTHYPNIDHDLYSEFMGAMIDAANARLSEKLITLEAACMALLEQSPCHAKDAIALQGFIGQLFATILKGEDLTSKTLLHLIKIESECKTGMTE
jgi:hypothetical protein